MKRFVLKSLLFYFPLLFFCIWGSFCTGEFGRLNGVPYGEYCPLQYPNEPYKNIYRNITGIDTTEILVIGDSYSHWPCNAWYQLFAQQKSSRSIRTLSHDVNFYNAPAVFYSLLNSGKIDSCKIVIIESAERHFIKRLLNFDSCGFQNIAENIAEIKDTTPIKSIPNLSQISLSNIHHISNVSRYLLKIKQTGILSVQLSFEAFSHPKYYSTLFLLEKNLIFKSIHLRILLFLNKG